MKKILFLLMVVIGLNAFGAELQINRHFVEDGKVWTYAMLNASFYSYDKYQIKFEGRTTIEGKDYIVANEYINDVPMSDLRGPYGYFREDEKGDVYYRGKSLNGLNVYMEMTPEWFDKINNTKPEEWPEVLVFSFRNAFALQLCYGEEDFVFKEISQDELETSEYEAPCGEKLTLITTKTGCYPELFMLEGVGLLSDGTASDLINIDYIPDIRPYGDTWLASVLDKDGNVLYCDEAYMRCIRQYNFSPFLQVGKTWNYNSRSCKNGIETEEIVSLQISNPENVHGCRFRCDLYRNGNSEPVQSQPWCYLWENAGQITATWNTEYNYDDSQDHSTMGRFPVCDLAKLDYTQLFFENVSDFAEVDYTGADGKKYLCYQNSEGTRLIEGVGFVFEGRPASLVGPIDDTAEEYTDRWYLYSVVDADGTEIYSDPRYRPGSGVFSVAADDTPTEYYNLQGVRVANPTTGLYIVRQGEKAAVKILK